MLAQARPGDVPGAAVARRSSRGTARMFCDITMPDGTPSLGRPAARAAPGAGARPPTPASPSTRTPRSSSSCSRTLPERGGAGAGRRRRLLRPHPARRQPGLPPRGDHDARAHGHLGGVQPPRGRARPAGDRPALRRRAVDGRQHPHHPARHQGGGADRRASTPPSCPSRSATSRAAGCTRTCRCSRATPTPSTTRPTRCTCRRWPSTSSPACSSTRPRSPRSPTSGSTPTSGSSSGGEAPPYVCWGSQQPQRAGARADVQADQGRLAPASRCAARTAPPTPTSASRCCSPPGSRASRRSTRCRPAPRTTSGRCPTPSAGRSASTPLPGSLAEAIAVMERSELVAETLGEHVFDFFLRNKRAEWQAYRARGHAVRARPLPAGAVTAARALVVTHSRDRAAGTLGEWLPAAGLELDVVAPVGRRARCPTASTDARRARRHGRAAAGVRRRSAPRGCAQTKDLLRAAVERRRAGARRSASARSCWPRRLGGVRRARRARARARRAARRQARRRRPRTRCSGTCRCQPGRRAVALGRDHRAAAGRGAAGQQPALPAPGVPRRRPRLGPAVPRRDAAGDGPALGRRRRRRRPRGGRSTRTRRRAHGRRAARGRGGVAPGARALRRPRRRRGRRAAACCRSADDRAALVAARRTTAPLAAPLLAALDADLDERYPGERHPAAGADGAASSPPPGGALPGRARSTTTPVGCGAAAAAPGPRRPARSSGCTSHPTARGRRPRRAAAGAGWWTRLASSATRRLVLETGTRAARGAAALRERAAGRRSPAYGHYRDSPLSLLASGSEP